MSTVAVVVIVIIALVVVAGVAALAVRESRRRRLSRRFGPEYDRAVKKHKNVREAERELLAREQRHSELRIRPLEPAARDRYHAEWTRLQERFVDAPETSVVEADRLIGAVMADRGYPADDFEQRARDLSVEHGPAVAGYRSAHDVSVRAGADGASTEDLRQAMVHYRDLFERLVDGTTRTQAEPAAREASAAHSSGKHAAGEPRAREERRP